MKRKKIGLAAALVLCVSGGWAQEQWTLDRCIDYAVENSIPVQQYRLRAENQEISLNTAKNSRLPGVNANLGQNMNFGRGPGRDGVYRDYTQMSTAIGASASVPVFEGMRINNTVKERELNLQASLQDLARAREDVALNVTSLYLKVLFNKELVAVAESQLELSRNKTERSRVLVETGKNPESALYESQAVMAKDELNLVQARNALTLSLLTLSQALNRDELGEFDVAVPAEAQLRISASEQLEQPDELYAYAVGVRPHIRAEELRLEGSTRSLRVAKSGRYPQISLSGGYSNGYYYSFAEDSVNPSFGEQLRRNGSESVGLSVGIPIFNRFATRNQIRSAQIDIRNQQLAITEAQRSLKKEIEQAYYDAQAAYQKYHTSVKALDAARIAFRYEEEKSASGLSTIFDYNEAKTQMLRAESDLVQAKYEYIFSRKILDFYAGKPLGFNAY